MQHTVQHAKHELLRGTLLFVVIGFMGVLMASFIGDEQQLNVSLEDMITAQNIQEGRSLEDTWGSRWLPHGNGEHPELFGMKPSARELRDPSCDFNPTSNTDDCEFKNCTYCPFTRCWARPNARIGDEANCDPKFPEAQDCPDLSVPNPVECPNGVGIEWEDVLDHQVQQDVSFDLIASLQMENLTAVLAPCKGGDQAIIPHANAHGCIRTQSTWWCHELIPAYQPKNAVTNSPAQCLNETSHTTFEMLLPLGSREQPNEWTIYVHYTFFTKADDGSLTKWHVTKGSAFLVLGERLKARDDVEATMNAIAVVVLLFPTLTFSILIFIYRKHWVMVASSWIMCELIVFGGFLGGIAIFAFIPGNLSLGGPVAVAASENDKYCLMRQWLVPLAFDFIVIPMTLKTWRVYCLFGKHQVGKRVTIPNQLLLWSFAAVIAVEVLFNTLWSALDGTALHVRQRFTDLDPNKYELECVSNDQDAQVVLTVISILMHLIPCLVLTFYAYKIRLSFSYQKVNEEYDVFDESLFIMLALLDLTVVGLFVIIFQAVIDSNPSSITVMRCCGIAWIVAFTLFVMFLPKFLRIKNWETERDPLTRRRSSATQSQSRNSASYSTGKPSTNLHKSNPLPGQTNGGSLPESSGVLNSNGLDNEEKGLGELSNSQPLPDPITPVIRGVVVDTSGDESEGEPRTMEEVDSDEDNTPLHVSVSTPTHGTMTET